MAVEKIWKLREGADADNVRQLSSELGVDPVLAELLVQRGVRTFEQARSFFRPSLDDLHDPFLMTDMEKAVSRVHDAVVSGEKILVYGDYDVDGTTAVSLVYSTFSLALMPQSKVMISLKPFSVAQSRPLYETP